MNVNRRKFLTTSTLSLICLGLTTDVFAKVFYSPKKIKLNLYTILQKLKQAADLRRSGSFDQAHTLYREIITLDSNEIRAYDGIRKVLLQQKFKELAVLQLYLNGQTLNPENPLFKERIAKEYMRLSLGNKKFNDQLNMAEDLLIKATILFEEVRQVLPDNEQISKQLEKADLKLSFSASTIDARGNQSIKAYKKENRQLHKNRFSGFTQEKIKGLLDDLLAKTDNDYRNAEVRENYRAYIKKLKQNGNFDLAAQFTKELYLFDKKDSLSLKIARNICEKDEKYEVLEAIERKNDLIKKSFWSKIALFDVLQKRYKKEGVGSLNEMKTILNSAATKKFSFYHTFEYKVRQVDLSILKNNLNEAKSLLDLFADTLIGTSSAHFIDKFNILCVKYYIKINNPKTAMEVLNIALKQNDSNNLDIFLQKLVSVNKNKEMDKSIHNERLNNFRIKLLNGF